VLDLLGEGADPLELAGRRSEGVLVHGHGVGCGHKFIFYVGDGTVQNLAYGLGFWFCGLSESDAGEQEQTGA
jgi:hypothetical protein